MDQDRISIAILALGGQGGGAETGRVVLVVLTALLTEVAGDERTERESLLFGAQCAGQTVHSLGAGKRLAFQIAAKV